METHDTINNAVRAFINTRLQQGKQGDELKMTDIFWRCREWITVHFII